MITTKDNGIRQYLTFWRGDIKDTTFTLKLRDTTSNERYEFADLEDLTPNRLTVMLSPELEDWERVPEGEFEYIIENTAGTRQHACGLLQNVKNRRTSEYEQTTEYSEYTPADW